MPGSFCRRSKADCCSIRRSHVATITTAWLVTVPVTALLGALCCLAMLSLAGL